MSDAGPEGGNPLRNSLWNLLYRIVSSTDRSGTAWGAILRGSRLGFFKEAIDELPASDNEASRRAMKRSFFELPDDRVYDLYEFLLRDDRAGLKEVDRKLLRRSLNGVLEDEGAPVRLLRDRFVPLQDHLGLDALASAEKGVSLFGLDAAGRHLQSAVELLAARTSGSPAEAVREAVLAVAAVVRTLSGESGPVAIGTIAPAADRLGMPAALRDAVDGVLDRCRAAGGFPPGETGGPAIDLPDASFLVVFCSGVIHLLLARSGGESPE